MPNLLEIVVQRGTPIAPPRNSAPPSIRYRHRVSKRQPIRRLKNYQPPPSVLRAMSEEAQAAHCGIPEDAATLVEIGASIVNSAWIRLLDVGAALRMISVESLSSVKLETSFTVELPTVKGCVREQICIPTGPSTLSQIFYANYLDSRGRPHTDEFGKPVFRRFIEQALPIPTNKITLVVRHVDTKLRVISAHYGDLSRKLPGTAGSTKEDQRWWFDPKKKCGYAMVLLKEMLRDRRIFNVTRTCPWCYE